MPPAWPGGRKMTGDAMRQDEQLHLGIALPNYGRRVAADEISAAAEQAERSGFDSCWVTDHIAVPEELSETYGTLAEALVTLGFIAGRTAKVRLGTSALVVPQRNPLVTLRQLLSLDLLSAGRLTVAVAAGWLEREFSLLGARFEDRGRWLDAWLDLATSVQEQAPGPIHHDGLVDIDGAWMGPGPASPDGIAFWASGNSRAGIRRAARLGIWHPVAMTSSDIAPLAAQLRELNDQARVILRLGVSFADAPVPAGVDERGRPAVIGPSNWVAEKLNEYLSIGCDGFVLVLGVEQPSLTERIHQFSEEVSSLLNKA